MEQAFYFDIFLMDSLNNNCYLEKKLYRRSSKSIYKEKLKIKLSYLYLKMILDLLNKQGYKFYIVEKVLGTPNEYEILGR